MYKNIVWDFDGTLFDAYPVMGEAFRITLLEFGVSESLEKIIDLMRISMSHLYQVYEKTGIMTESFMTQLHKKRQDHEELFLKPFEDAKTTLEEICLRGGQNFLYTHRDYSAVKFIKKYQLEIYFSGYVTKEDAYKRKPDPEALVSLCSKYHLFPEETLMVGDRDIDIYAAQNAGIASCYYNYGYFKDIDAANHKIVKLHEVLEIIT